MINELQSIGIEVKNGMFGQVKVRCPKCSDTRKNKYEKCLSVNVNTGVWNCHNCSYSGSIKKPKKSYVRPEVGELRNLSQPVIDWFAARGISNQTLLRYKITEGIDYMPQVEKEVKTIHFNYYYDGELVNIKYRDSAKNFKLVSGAMLVPYGIDVCLDNSTDSIVITEGEIDCLSFYEAGIKNVISVPNGASQNAKLEWLEDCYSIFEKKNIYLATDMDEAGISLRNELARRLGKQNCWIIEFPYKDANEVFVHGGQDMLVECYNSASPYPVDGIEDAHMVHTELLKLYEEGTPRGFKVGYEMDKDFNWHKGQVTLITGIPGHGKSTFLKNIMYRLAEQDWKFFIYSAEEANTAFALSDLYQISTGKSFFKNEFAQRITKEEIEERIDFMQDHFKYYKLTDNDLTINGIIAKGEEMVKRYGINGFVIDNMSTIEKGMPKYGDSRHNTIGEMMNQLVAFARNYEVHVFLVAHPKKMNKVKSGVYDVPHGYDVGESSFYYNLPDNGLTVYRNYETMQTEVHRWKVRFKYTGQTGVSYFTFNLNNSRYESTEKVNDGSDKEKFFKEPYKSDPVQREVDTSKEWWQGA